MVLTLKGSDDENGCTLSGSDILSHLTVGFAQSARPRLLTSAPSGPENLAKKTRSCWFATQNKAGTAQEQNRRNLCNLRMISVIDRQHLVWVHRLRGLHRIKPEQLKEQTRRNLCNLRMISVIDPQHSVSVVVHRPPLNVQRQGCRS